MSQRENHSRISNLKLERYLLGELEAEEMARIEIELRSDEVLRRRVEDLVKSNEELLARYPADWMASRIRGRLEEATAAPQRVRTGTRKARLWPIPALAAAAAAVLMLFLLPPPGEWFRTEQVSHVDTRIKGLEPQIRLFRKTDTGSERLDNGATAREHDLILIQYEAAGKAFGTILSIDGNGSITRHAPLKGSKPVKLMQEGAVSLDFSYELDAAPRWEKFYFVTSDSLFDVDDVLDAARETTEEPRGERSDSLRLPNGLDQMIFTLEKEAGHE